MEKIRKKWKICTEYFNNCEFIYPTQQKKVKKMLDYLSSNPNVKSITLFGSSITPNCTIDSDIDIYVEIKNNEKLINQYFDFSYDLWTNYTIDERMLEEINKKGLIVYEQ